MGEKTEKYIIRMKQGSNPAEKVIEEIRDDKVKELTATRAELEIAKLKAEIRKLNAEGEAVSSNKAVGLVSAMIAQNFSDPRKAQEFLGSLDEQSLNNLAVLLAADNPRADAFMNIARSPTTSVKDMIEIVKMMQPQTQTSLKDIAEVFKMGIDSAKATQPQPTSQQEGYKFVMDTFVKPFQEMMTKSQEAVWTAKLETLEAKMPPPLDQQIEHYKKIGEELGLNRSSGKASEIDIQLENMRQSHDLDMKALSWEQQKFLLQQEAERDKWTAIQQTFAPIMGMAAPEIRGAFRKIGQDLGKGMEGVGKPSTNPTASTQQEIALFTCPNCKTELNVHIPPNAPKEVPIKCPKCGSITSASLKQTEPAKEEEALPPPPPEEKPSNTRLKPIYR